MPGRAARAPRPDPLPAPSGARDPTERWLSGRKHRTRNAAYGQPYRGFESHPLRHTQAVDFIAKIAEARRPRTCAIVGELDDWRGTPQLDQMRQPARNSLAVIWTVPFEFGDP